MAAALACASALAVAAPATGGVQYTDIWWAQDGTEPGWGVNLAQNADTIFATFFVYGPDRQPIWYTATMKAQPSGSFTGGMYQTSGPWFGTQPFNPQTVTIAQVGTATFTPASSVTGTLAYSVGGTNVVKPIERQLLVGIDFSGSYTGLVYGEVTGCTNPADNETVQGNFDATVTQSGDQVTMDIVVFGESLTCRLQGARTQKGWVSNIPNATLACGPEPATNAVVEELVPTGAGFEAILRYSPGEGCAQRANIVAVRKQS
jgi:hypothetical protein